MRPGHQAGPATEELGVELLPETLAQQVEGKRVHAGVGEGQEAGTDAGDKVEHGGVHFGVVVRAVQVDDMVGEPAEGKEAHEHQHCLSQALSGFDLWRESPRERQGDRGTGWGNTETKTGKRNLGNRRAHKVTENEFHKRERERREKPQKQRKQAS